MSKVEEVSRAIDAVQLFLRFNDWTSDKVEGLPIEICRYGNDDEEDVVVIKRFPSRKGRDAALYEVVSEMRARAAIEAMKIPTDAMQDAVIQGNDHEVSRGQGSLLRGVSRRVSAAIDAALSEEG